MNGQTEQRTVGNAGRDAPVGFICGGGTLPYAVADAVLRSGRPVHLFPIKGAADAAAVARFPHHWVSFGRAGQIPRLLKEAGCRDVVFIGSLVRPALSEFWLDWSTIKLIPRIARMLRGGDDHLLSGVARIFEEYGFRVIGAHEAAPEILVPMGALGAAGPGARDLDDIALGLEVLRASGSFDVGQAVVVADKRVVALEAAEGTDEMLLRVADLRRRGLLRTPEGVGVLVKAPKPRQDLRVDLPSIGPKTVEGVAAAGLAGLAVVAGSSIMAQADVIVRTADRLGVFVAGVAGEGGR